jgi:hypothetical protein
MKAKSCTSSNASSDMNGHVIVVDGGWMTRKKIIKFEMRSGRLLFCICLSISEFVQITIKKY